MKTICLYLRLWRRRNNLYFISPELLDKLMVKNYNNQRTMLLVVLNVFFDLFHENPNSTSINNDFDKILMENLFDDLPKFSILNEINAKIIKEVELIQEKKFNEIFEL